MTAVQRDALASRYGGTLFPAHTAMLAEFLADPVREQRNTPAARARRELNPR